MAKKTVKKNVRKSQLYKIGGLRVEHRQMLAKALDMAPVPSLTVEIGSLVGRSAVFIVRRLRKIGRKGELLYCIEPHARGTSSSGNLQYGPQDRREFYANMVEAGVASSCALIGLPSRQAARVFDEKTIGMLYVDGNHLFGPLCADIDAYVSKVIPGAPILFDDYMTKHGSEVIPAVDQAVAEGQIEVVEQFDTQILCRRPL